MIRKIAAVVVITLMFAQYTTAARPESNERSIRVAGREKITVTTSTVYLGDVAEITSPLIDDDDAIIALQKLSITSSPSPGEELTLSAAQVLNKMRTAGVNLETVGYVFPRVITVKRAWREIGLEEVRSAIEHFIETRSHNLSLRNISYPRKERVAPGLLALKVEPAGVVRGGRVRFHLSADTEDGRSESRFTVGATLDEWVEVPVASRPIVRGEVVRELDLRMARLNVRSLPRDAARDLDVIVGHEISRTIAEGEVFRKSKLAIPPVIEVGSQVTILYDSELLHLTVSGVALEAGIEGQAIRVRNTDSKRVVTATVVEAGLVKVN